MWHSLIWDANPDYPLYGRLTDVIKILKGKNIRSVYHEFYNEDFGNETKPTLFMYHRRNRPYHVDYCFASSDFKVSNVEVGNSDEWIAKSDHMPIIVTFDEQGYESSDPSIRPLAHSSTLPLSVITNSCPMAADWKYPAFHEFLL
jgi:hypothetical protein